MSNARTAARFFQSLIADLESRAVAAGHLTRRGLQLLRAAAAYRNCRAMRGVL